jgi:hypothetical protein
MALKLLHKFMPPEVYPLVGKGPPLVVLVVRCVACLLPLSSAWVMQSGCFRPYVVWKTRWTSPFLSRGLSRSSLMWLAGCVCTGLCLSAYAMGYHLRNNTDVNPGAHKQQLAWERFDPAKQRPHFDFLEGG